MKKYVLVLFVAFITFSECSRVPVTGRKQLNLIPNSEVLSQSIVEYDSFLLTHKVITGTPEANMVSKVGQRLAKAVQDYMNSQNLGDEIKDFKWEYHLVEDKEANAWCMPGGKIVV